MTILSLGKSYKLVIKLFQRQKKNNKTIFSLGFETTFYTLLLQLKLRWLKNIEKEINVEF